MMSSEPPAAPWDRRSWQRKRAPKLIFFDPPLPPRFSLLTLFGVVTATAVYCGLLRLFRVYAVVLLFLLLFGLYWLKVPRERRAAKWLVIDLLVGIVLPTGCLYFDPIIFRTDGRALQLAAYSFFGAEMIVLFVWLTLGALFNDYGRSVVWGVFTVGWLVCLGLGLLLILPAILGLLIRPFAILGFAPWFTFNAYLSNARRAQYAIAAGRRSGWGFLLGFALVAALPFAVGRAVNLTTPSAKAFWPAGLEEFLPED